MVVRSRFHGGVNIAAGVLFVLAFVSTTAYDAMVRREAVIVATERELGNLSRALAEQTTRSLQTVDILLRDTASWYELTGRKLPADSVDLTLAAFTAAVPQVQVLSVVDAQGMQQHRSRQTQEPLADVSDRPYFTAQRDGKTSELFINDPIVTRTDGSRAIVTSRKIRDARGQFAGVVTAIVTLDVLQRAYDSVQLADRAQMHLTLKDGRLIVSLPAATPDLNRKIPEITRLVLQDGEAAVSRVEVDGRRKIVAAADVRSHPLVVALMRDESDVLRPWREEARNILVRTVAMALFILIAVAAIVRQLRRLEQNAIALQQSEARYAMAMDAANEGHAEWNIARDEVFLSARWCAIHQIPAGQALLTFAALESLLPVHPADRLQVQLALNEHLEGLRPDVEIEYRIQDGLQAWHWVRAKGRCLRDRAGTATHFHWAAVDITHLKQIDAQKAQLQAQLQQSRHLESLGTMAGGIAHDFNNILGAILGYGEMAQRDAPVDSPPRRHVDKMMQAGLRAKALVRRILDFSRSGYSEMHLVGVQALVEEALAMLSPTLPAHIRLVPRLEAPDSLIYGDASQVHQVVMNLCANAIQAMSMAPGTDGVLTVTLERQALAHEQVFSHGRLPAGPYVRLSVSDTGPGIAPAVFARMFDPFFTTRQVGEATGLGLSVVHGVVADLQGAVDVATVQGAGTRFCILLPSKGEGPLPVAEPAPAPAGDGAVVMVVDDEPALVEITEDMLARLGYEPVGFTSSESAWAAFQQTPARFDVVLTDEKLPGLSGTGLTARIKALRPDIPVIVMSGFGGDGLADRLGQAGVAELLHKPLVARDIAQALHRALHRNA